MQIMDQFGAAPGAESVRMPDGTERTLAAEHAAAILVNEQPAFRVVCTPELLPQLGTSCPACSAAASGWRS